MAGVMNGGPPPFIIMKVYVMNGGVYEWGVNLMNGGVYDWRGVPVSDTLCSSTRRKITGHILTLISAICPFSRTISCAPTTIWPIAF